jgi:hypothetical protein
MAFTLHYSLSPIKYTLLLLLLNYFLLHNPVQSIEITIFDSFCKEESVYKPYVKYYNGRTQALETGIPVKTYGPGFHTDFMDPSMESIYVCVNGM